MSLEMCRYHELRLAAGIVYGSDCKHADRECSESESEYESETEKH